MLSRGERIFWGGLAAAAIAGGVAAWWTADQWTPHAGPWAAQLWHKATRPDPDTLPQGSPARKAGAAAAPMAQPRKCVKDGQVTYTDQPCPPGSRELVVDGAVTFLPSR